MAIFREIVTKAVVGKGRKQFIDTYSITPQAKVSTVLGCWLINHEFRGSQKNQRVIIDGVFDLNLWYAYDDNTKTAVYNQKIKYSKTAKVNIKDASDLTNETEIIIRALKQPSCTKVELKDDHVELVVEQELGIELVGDTKIQVPIGSDSESWDIIPDEMDEEKINAEIDANIKEDFIK